MVGELDVLANLMAGGLIMIRIENIVYSQERQRPVECGAQSVACIPEGIAPAL